MDNAQSSSGRVCKIPTNEAGILKTTTILLGRDRVTKKIQIPQKECGILKMTKT
jgi:hypothetical protein